MNGVGADRGLTWAPDPPLRPYSGQCRVFVAPLRFGSGISCKVVEAMGNGIPAVVSPLVAMGLGLTHERDVLIGGDDDEFIRQVIRLYTDAAIWQRLQHNGTVFVRRHCSPSMMRETLGDVLNLRGASARRERPPMSLLRDLVDLPQ